jgi:outer membrane receptor protein involved in Fe transport
VDHTLRPFTSSTVTVGGNLRYQRSNSTNLGGTAHSQVVGGVFVQDQQELVKDRLSLFGAVGVSDHPEIPVQVDGNAALIATVVPNHTLRFSFGRAHRDPSFGENFINFRRKFGPADGFQEPNLELEPESIKAWEAGYHGRADLGSARLQLFAEGFKERISDLIGIVTTNVGAGTVPDLPTVTVLQQFRNLETRDGKGFEVGGDVSGRGAHLAVQYAYQEFKNVATGATIVNDIPRHKFSSGLGLSRGALELDAWVHVVSDTQVEGYVLLNPRVGVKLGSWVLSAQGFNMLNDRHVETVNGRGIRGETIGRLITASVSYRGR